MRRQAEIYEVVQDGGTYLEVGGVLYAGYSLDDVERLLQALLDGFTWPDNACEGAFIGARDDVLDRACRPYMSGREAYEAHVDAVRRNAELMWE